MTPATTALDDERLSNIYGAAAEELVRRGHKEFSEAEFLEMSTPS